MRSLGTRLIHFRTDLGLDLVRRPVPRRGIYGHLYARGNGGHGDAAKVISSEEQVREFESTQPAMPRPHAAAIPPRSPG